MIISSLMKGTELKLLPFDALWQREVASVDENDLHDFMRRHHDSEVAEKEALQLVNVAYKYANARSQMPPSLCNFYFVKNKLTPDEFRSRLQRVPQERRRAILFALETGMDIRDVVELTWKNLPPMFQFSEFAGGIVRGLVRHFKLPYVFWEIVQNGVAAPLFGLGTDAEEVAQGHGFARFRLMYAKMIFVDQVQEEVDFIHKPIEICNESSERD